MAKACRLFTNDSISEVSVITENWDEIRSSLESGMTEFIDGDSSLELVAISGTALAVIASDKDLFSLLLQLVSVAKTTIFVRMAPSQKVQAVDIAKKHLKMKVLAIGDGYNDTLMLQAAHVGIRINNDEADSIRDS